MWTFIGRGKPLEVQHVDTWMPWRASLGLVWSCFEHGFVRFMVHRKKQIFYLNSYIGYYRKIAVFLGFVGVFFYGWWSDGPLRGALQDSQNMIPQTNATFLHE